MKLHVAKHVELLYPFGLWGPGGPKFRRPFSDQGGVVSSWVWAHLYPFEWPENFLEFLQIFPVFMEHSPAVFLFL